MAIYMGMNMLPRLSHMAILGEVGINPEDVGIRMDNVLTQQYGLRILATNDPVPPPARVLLSFPHSMSRLLIFGQRCRGISMPLYSIPRYSINLINTHPMFFVDRSISVLIECVPPHSAGVVRCAICNMHYFIAGCFPLGEIIDREILRPGSSLARHIYFHGHSFSPGFFILDNVRPVEFNPDISHSTPHLNLMGDGHPYLANLVYQSHVHVSLPVNPTLTPPSDYHDEDANICPIPYFYRRCF